MRIKQLREQYGYSQEGIAGIVGMSQTTYSGWEKTFPEQLTRLAALADRAGVRNASVHRFRHTFAVGFLRNGGNVFALQEILGHARIDTVKIYVRLAERDLADAQRRASPVDNWRL